ncbi:MAG: 1-deoxy-D-xylulose-5-phosphate synthase [Lachnospiraceae bacterium]|nr:1-deoxy-D-xylulose-5-phosphate synthase [Ruminococcus sp.]MCM1273919.1 1-deoxy-D-xylulose-5-phosphate synthase [Lachnospiraceae bacterium]
MLLDDNIDHDIISHMTTPQLKALCRELRSCILRTVMKNGGHLSSNLGTVELAVAIHYVYDVFGGDKVIWDVGHQAYAHKLLTGRFSGFDTLRKKGGVSGFTRRAESPADAFVSGHSSTSVSAAYGISTAMRLKGESGAVAAVIGDGALTGGMAYEGLNNAGKTASNLTLILNDNAMSISKSTGALARYLAHIRSTRKYYRAKERVKTVLSSVPLVGRSLERAVAATKTLVKEALYDSSNLFENLGFAYIGPVDGHNIEDLTEALSVAKLMKRPCVVHVFTRKGRGYKPAESNPGEYHAVAANGAVEEFAYNDIPTHVDGSFSEAFGRELERLGKSDGRICAITAAMKYAVGLNYFKNSCCARFFDTGIAEQHSVTFAAGLAVQGMLPVFAVYSTFLQRGFDQIIHDCAIENTHITLCIDRAGFVGADGETHQGVFDVPMLRAVPNTVIYCPATFAELRKCLSEAIYRTEGIACVRYPKGGEPDFSGVPERFKAAFEPAVSFYYSGKTSRVLGIAYGRISASLAAACGETGADMLRLVAINPFPEEIFDIALGYDKIVFFEEGSLRGGAAEGFLAELARRGYRGRAETVGVGDGFVPMAAVEEQLAMYGLDADGMAKKLEG